MKIMTFNVQHFENFNTHEIDFSSFAEYIKNSGADIVGLNEIRSKGIDPDYENQMEIISKLSGIENYYFAKAIDFDGKNPYGNGMLSKFKIENIENIPIPDPIVRAYDGYYETRCLIKAKLENGITVMVTHFGLNPDEHENAAKTVAENLEKEKCILMGDFNVTPESDILKPIRAKMKDTSKYFTENLLSFPSDNPEVKIDYIFVSEDIEVIKADIPSVVLSDHRPHMAEINI